MVASVVGGSLGENYKIILIDWDRQVIVRISSETNLVNYLNDELRYEVNRYG